MRGVGVYNEMVSISLMEKFFQFNNLGVLKIIFIILIGVLVII